MGNTPVNDSLERAAYNGYRVTHEPNDGGPYYVTHDEWSDQDHDAWRNSVGWVLHFGLGGADIDRIITHLKFYKNHLEDMEAVGALETNLPIDGSSATSYSAEVGDILDKLQGRLK